MPAPVICIATELFQSATSRSNRLIFEKFNACVKVDVRVFRTSPGVEQVQSICSHLHHHQHPMVAITIDRNQNFVSAKYAHVPIHELHLGEFVSIRSHSISHPARHVRGVQVKYLQRFFSSFLHNHHTEFVDDL
jgi:hypothetical protein